MDGKTENISRGRENGPTSELGGAKKQAEHWEEDEHFGEEVFPLFEPRFGVWKKITDKSQRRNHDEESDESLAHGDSGETDDDRDEGAEDNREYSPEECTNTTGDGDAEGGEDTGAGEGVNEVGPSDLDGWNGAV